MDRLAEPDRIQGVGGAVLGHLHPDEDNGLEMELTPAQAAEE